MSYRPSDEVKKRISETLKSNVQVMEQLRLLHENQK